MFWTAEPEVNAATALAAKINRAVIGPRIGVERAINNMSR
jgi:hypothetical protein